MPHSFPDHIRLTPFTVADIGTLALLAATIWRSHYTPIIGAAQVEYMLAGRYTAEKLQPYLAAFNEDRRWLALLRDHNDAIGYLSYALTDNPQEMKLEQLYLLPARHGEGLGGAMLRHVEAEARALGKSSLMLTVNRHNAGSIAVYRQAGFTVREEAQFDIGNGFVMDDYVMVKVL